MTPMSEIAALLEQSSNAFAHLFCFRTTQYFGWPVEVKGGLYLPITSYLTFFWTTVPVIAWFSFVITLLASNNARSCQGSRGHSLPVRGGCQGCTRASSTWVRLASVSLHFIWNSWPPGYLQAWQTSAGRGAPHLHVGTRLLKAVEFLQKL